ncbi:hypothetical protein [Paenimyroides viscosum]|jgi:hypothetical protein|uniref:Uncharacterized protein n=1 Tax=Paenimyroides viscosum TaxID=2488729 RepID=A0A3P1B0D6_9FLAO|nr:hypothetical protein [Paenimyroides viscosum]RRA94776.1 hypothetical protein EG242_07990 [Paenimyroides viscosum]
MKTKLFTLIFGAILFASCQQKEMKISRSDFSVVTEMTDFSPAYIIKNEEGKVEIKKNSLIGNTHWVLSVDRDLTLNEVAPFLQELTAKKHKKGGMHEDTKDIYMVYSDTVHKQNACVKMPFKSFALGEQPVYELGEGVQSLLLKSVADAKNTFDKTQTYLVRIDKNISVETFVNILIELEKQNVSENVNSEVYVN